MSDRLTPGTLLADRFEIRRFLGAGSFGEVYEAKQRVMDLSVRELALKLFKAEFVSRENIGQVLTDVLMLVRLLDEDPPAEVARRIVQIYDVGVLSTDLGDRVFMSMQLIRTRKTLDHEIRRHRHGGMPVALSLWYLERLLIPLAWMHEQSIVHGDLKPDNVLLREDKDLLLTDFGLAARREVGAQGGALVWSSPETLNRVGGDVQSDIYSVGLIWYAMLTGQVLFEQVGLSALGAGDDTLYRQEHIRARKWSWAAPGEYEPGAQLLASPIDYNDELQENPAVLKLLQSCLKYRVGERCPHAGTLLKALRQYAEGEQLPGWIGQDNDTTQTPTQGIEAAANPRAVTNPELAETLEAVLKLREAGEIPKAMQRLGGAMKRWPNEYQIVAQLSQLYEQTGQLTLANRFRQLANKLKG